MTKTKFEAMDILNKYDIPCGPILSMKEIAEEPSLRATGTVVEVDHPTRGKYLTVGNPIKMSASMSEVKRSPLLGEHTDGDSARRAALRPGAHRRDRGVRRDRRAGAGRRGVAGRNRPAATPRESAAGPLFRTDRASSSGFPDRGVSGLEKQVEHAAPASSRHCSIWSMTLVGPPTKVVGYVPPTLAVRASPATLRRSRRTSSSRMPIGIGNG